MNYDAIFQWDMSPAEAEVYKLALVYEEEFLNTFKDHMDGLVRRKNSLPKRGDPRKSNLFRHCWKLRRETKGLLEPHQYRLYIRANQTILLMNHKKGDKKGKVHVEPNAICGEKAWIRWKVYERWYNTKAAIINPKDERSWYGLGVALHEKGDFPDAVEAFHNALRLRPKYTLAWFRLGLAHHYNDNLPEAIKAYEETLRLDPYNTLAGDALTRAKEEMD